MAGDLSQKTNFIILFQGRTGSSFLVDALNRHPDIFAAGELLADLTPPDEFETSTRIRKVRAGIRRFRRGCPPEQQLGLTRRFYDDGQSGKRVIGFKTKVRDALRLHELKSVLESRAVRAIVLERKNLVKQTISRLNAQRLHDATHEWNLKVADRRPGPFSVSASEFDRMLQEVIFDDRTLNAFADYLDLPILRLEYADLLSNRKAWFGAVFDFLEVQPSVLDSSVLKNTDDDLRNVLVNLNEVKERYYGTEIEPMFES